MLTVGDFFGLLGSVSLYGGVAVCVLSIILAGVFLTRLKARLWQALYAALRMQVFLLGLAVVCLGVLLQINAFEYNLVFNSAELGMTWYQKLGGLWSSQAGSLLFFLFIFSIMVLQTFRLSLRLRDWRVGVLGVLILNVTLLFFIFPPAFWVNPFEKFWLLENGSISTAVFSPHGGTLVVPTEGRGLTPNLRHIAMLLHPPFLYMGMMGLFIPYALSMATLI